MVPSDYGRLPAENASDEPDDFEYDPDLAPTIIQGVGGDTVGDSRRFAEAQTLFDAHDYVGCVRLLGTIPSEQRSPNERRLRERAASIVEEIGALKDELRRGVRERSYDGLLPKARRYVELKPDDEKYARLCQKLEEREAGRSGAESPPSSSEATAPTSSQDIVQFVLRYVLVGAFAGAVLGALIGGFWKPEGYFLGGLIGGILAAANEWMGRR